MKAFVIISGALSLIATAAIGAKRYDDRLSLEAARVDSLSAELTHARDRADALRIENDLALAAADSLRASTGRQLDSLASELEDLTREEVVAREASQEAVGRLLDVTTPTVDTALAFPAVRTLETELAIVRDVAVNWRRQAGLWESRAVTAWNANLGLAGELAVRRGESALAAELVREQRAATDYWRAEATKFRVPASVAFAGGLGVGVIGALLIN